MLPLPNAQTQVMRAHDGPAMVARWSASGKYCITAGYDRTVKLWNPHREDPDGGGPLLIQTFKGPHGHPVHDVCISHDDARFASCGEDKGVFVWDVAQSRVARKFFGHTQRVNSVAFNAESTVLITASYDATIRAWDCKSHNNSPIQVISDFGDSVSKVVTTPSEIIASCIDGSVRTFDLRAGKQRMDKFPGSVTHVSLSNDGGCLLASSLVGDGRLFLLEKASGELLNSYVGHKNESYHIGSCFSNTDAYVASGSEDGSIVFWDLVEGNKVHTLRGHTRAVCSLSYHPKTPSLLSASFDGTVRLWEMKSVDA